MWFLFWGLLACSGNKDDTDPVGPTCDPAEDPDTAPADLEGRADCGELTYLDRCAVCHADDGTGAIGPAIFRRVPQLTDHELISIMSDGTATMPEPAVDNQEIADVLAYLRSTF